MCSIGTAPCVRAAIYARVSCEQQVQAQTIAIQVEALQERLRQEGMAVDPELMFLDDGYSGANLVRPALERLRDTAAAGGIERLYVYSPDRLSRRQAHQVLLLEELHGDGPVPMEPQQRLGDAEEPRLQGLGRLRQDPLRAAATASAAATGRLDAAPACLLDLPGVPRRMDHDCCPCDCGA